MVKYLEKLGVPVRMPHQRYKGKIYNENTKPDRQKQKRFVLLRNSQVYEQTSHSPHPYDVPLKIVYAGRV
jgi:hypothetical protein